MVQKLGTLSGRLETLLLPCGDVTVIVFSPKTCNELPEEDRLLCDAHERKRRELVTALLRTAASARTQRREANQNLNHLCFSRTPSRCSVSFQAIPAKQIGENWKLRPEVKRTCAYVTQIISWLGLPDLVIFAFLKSFARWHVPKIGSSYLHSSTRRWEKEAESQRLPTAASRLRTPVGNMNSIGYMVKRILFRRVDYVLGGFSSKPESRKTNHIMNAPDRFELFILPDGVPK